MRLQKRLTKSVKHEKKQQQVFQGTYMNPAETTGHIKDTWLTDVQTDKQSDRKSAEKKIPVCKTAYLDGAKTFPQDQNF